MSSLPDLFHISEIPLPLVLKPRIMDYHTKVTGGKKSIFTENDMPHVSFGPSVYNCFLSIFTLVAEYMQSKEGIRDGIFFHVYKALPGPRTRFITPDVLTKKEYVWDAHVTKEHWILDEINIAYCGVVKIDYDPEPDWYGIYPYDNRKYDFLENCFQPVESFKIKQTLKLRGDKHRITLYP